MSAKLFAPESFLILVVDDIADNLKVVGDILEQGRLWRYFCHKWRTGTKENRNCTTRFDFVRFNDARNGWFAGM